MTHASPPQPIRRKVIRTAAAVICLAGVLAIARYIPAAENLTRIMASWKHSAAAPFTFLILGVFYTACGLPRQVLCAIAGVIFGFTVGIILTTLAATLGNLVDFYFARWVRSHQNSGPTRPAKARSGWRQRLASLGQIAAQKPFRTILLLRLMPVGSALLVALGAGYQNLPVGPFLAATLIGTLPQNLVFVLIGSGTHVGHGAQIAMGVTLFVISSSIGVAFAREARRAEAQSSTGKS